MSVKYVIIGASAAGTAAAKEILSADPDGNIIIFSKEDRYPYYRPMLSEFIADRDVESKSSFQLNKQEWYENPAITFMPGVSVTGIDRDNRKVSASDGENYSFDKLIIAAGSNPLIPIKEQPDFRRIFSLRTYDDAERISDAASKSKRASVIGGGLLGLEAAYSLKKLGLEVVIIELAEQLMAAQLDKGGADFLLNVVKSRGVDVVLGDSVGEVDNKKDGLELSLKSGDKIESDILVISAGVRPDVELAENCGLEINSGVVVDDRMTTSDPDIFACGDLAEYSGKLTPLWMAAMKKGRIAGANAAGKKLEYTEEDYPVALSTFDIKLFSAGAPSAEEADSVVKTNDSAYSSVFFSEGRMTGFVQIGDTGEAQKFLKHLKSGSEHHDLKEEGLI